MVVKLPLPLPSCMHGSCHPPPRHAMTSMSMTPFCIKTASIPTSAKILQKVALNNNLTNELEGATIIKKDMFKSKTHYVLLLYSILNVKTPKPSALRSQDSDKVPLYVP